MSVKIGLRAVAARADSVRGPTRCDRHVPVTTTGRFHQGRCFDRAAHRRSHGAGAVARAARGRAATQRTSCARGRQPWRCSTKSLRRSPAGRAARRAGIASRRSRRKCCRTMRSSSLRRCRIGGRARVYASNTPGSAPFSEIVDVPPAVMQRTRLGIRPRRRSAGAAGSEASRSDPTRLSFGVARAAAPRRRVRGGVCRSCRSRRRNTPRRTCRSRNASAIACSKVSRASGAPHCGKRSTKRRSGPRDSKRGCAS